MSGLKVDMLFGFAYDPDVRVRRISQALAAAGYEVRIFAWDRSGTRPAHQLDGPVAIHRIHILSQQGRGWTQLFFLARAVARYVPHIVRRRPDVLHAIDLPMLLAAILIAPLLGRRPTIVYDAFEIYAIMESQKYPRWLLGVLHAAERLLPRFADLVITPGDDRSDYFAKRGIGSAVVPNWIDPAPEVVNQAEARRSLGLDDGSLTILYAGGLDPSRDVRSLVDHARRHPDHTVLIAGQGEQEPLLRKAAATVPNLQFLGWLPDPSILLRASDMLYYSLRPDHPYAVHAAPNNLYTAIAYGVPFLFREQGEIKLVAERHLIGAAFSDAGTLDEAVAHLAEPGFNAEVRESLTVLGTRYTWAAASRRLLEAYPKPPIAATSRASVNGE